MRLRHPSTRRLQRWLDGAENQLGKHLETCERCVDRAESLSTGEMTVGPALMALLSPSEGVTERLRGGIDDRLRSGEDFTLIAELFGLPIRAARIMTIQGDS